MTYGKKPSVLTFLLMIIIISTFAQLTHAQPWRTKPFSFEVFNNATLRFPQSLAAPFRQQIHPGVAIGYEFGWKETIKDPMFANINTHALGGKKVATGKWFQNVAMAYYYHKNLNHAFTITSKAGYRRYINKFSVEAGLHLGYMHAFGLTERSVIQAYGSYRTSNGPGKPSLIGGVGMGVGYDAGYRHNIRRIYINFDQRLQLPFSSTFSDILPHGLLALGIQFTLFKNSSETFRTRQERLACPEE